MLAALLSWIALPAGSQETLLGLGQPEPEAEAPARAIAQTSSLAEDRALAKRLGEIYAQVEGLTGIEIEVHAGVVQLSGEVFSAGAHSQAIKIARQLQGVVEVRDEISESRDLERRLQPALDDLRERMLDFAAGIPLFAVSAVVFVLFVVAGRVATRWEAAFRPITQNPFARDLARQAVRAVFFVLGAIVALDILDATAVVAAVAGIAGLAGLAISFAFRDLVENYIASVLLSLRQPFQADDHVVIEGQEGRVVRLNSRATILMTLDGNHVRIPNAAVYKGTILNYSRNPERRLGFDVGVAGPEDLSAALALGVAALRAMPGVLPEPSPTGWVGGFGDWFVGLRFSAWIDQRETDWFKARGEAMRVVKEAFDRAGIVMPDPTLVLRSSPTSTDRPSEQVRAVGEVPPAAPEADISRDTQIDEAVAEDRAAGGGDLLDATRPQE